MEEQQVLYSELLAGLRDERSLFEIELRKVYNMKAVVSSFVRADTLLRRGRSGLPKNEHDMEQVYEQLESEGGSEALEGVKQTACQIASSLLDKLFKTRIIVKEFCIGTRTSIDAGTPTRYVLQSLANDLQQPELAFERFWRILVENIITPSLNEWRFEPSERSALVLKKPKVKLSKLKDSVLCRIVFDPLSSQTTSETRGDAWAPFLQSWLKMLVTAMLFVRKIVRNCGKDGSAWFSAYTWPRLLNDILIPQLVKDGTPAGSAEEAWKYQGAIKSFVKLLKSKFEVKGLIPDNASWDSLNSAVENLHSHFLKRIRELALLKVRRVIVEDQYNEYKQDHGQELPAGML